METDMPFDSYPRRDPAQLTRLRQALMLPFMIGMVPAFLFGHLLGEKPGAILAVTVYGVAALIVLARLVESAPVDNYLRTGAGEDGWVGVAIASAEVGQAAVIVGRSGVLDAAACSDRIEASPSDRD